jgi:hypothetical protein
MASVAPELRNRGGICATSLGDNCSEKDDRGRASVFLSPD